MKNKQKEWHHATKHLPSVSARFCAASFLQPSPNQSWEWISWPQTNSWWTLPPDRFWMQIRSALSPNQPLRRPAPGSPPHSAVWHPPSEISLPPFHPSSAMGPELQARNMVSNTPLKPRAARSSPRHAAWTRTSCALQKLSSGPWRRPG